MKKILTTTFFLSLLLTLSLQARAQNASPEAPTVEQLTLTFDLGELPGCCSAESLWQVSYQWRIADQRDFIRWSMEGEDPTVQDGVGMLLSKQTFTRRNLSDADSRRFVVTVPVRGELYARLRSAGRRQQIVWLDATVRVRDGGRERDLIKKVNPAWGPSFYQSGNARVRMELTDDWKMQWYTSTTAPWAQDHKVGLSSAKTPAPE